MTGDPGAPVFREEQRLIWPFWVLVAVPALVSWWIFIRQIGQRHTVGSNPAPDWMVWLIWIGAGFGLPVLFLTHRMVTEVWADSVSIRWRPVTRRVIPLAEIVGCAVRDYRPIREFGGWGVRGLKRSRRMAYSASGHRGVELTLRDGRRVVIGSRQPERLAGALHSVMQASHEGVDA